MILHTDVLKFYRTNWHHKTLGHKYLMQAVTIAIMCYCSFGNFHTELLWQMSKPHSLIFHEIGKTFINNFKYVNFYKKGTKFGCKIVQVWNNHKKAHLSIALFSKFLLDTTNLAAKCKYTLLEIKPCGLVSRIRDVEALWYKTEIIYFVQLCWLYFQTSYGPSE